MPPSVDTANQSTGAPVTSKMAGRGIDEYNRIQQMIYTRWVNQKLGSRQFPMLDDVLADIGKDDHLSNLVTALCETEMPKPAKKEKRVVRAQNLDWVKRQLDFVYSCGVEMKLKPSQENIFDGDSRDIMGLVYAMMLKFLRFEDEDGESAGDARAALLRWCQFHTKGFANVNVTNLTKSWQSGLALCALINKFHPDALDYGSLEPTNAVGNIRLAMEAGQRLFGVECFLSPEQFVEITKAKDGDKAMLVVLSEYYYGINEWFKRQLAGKRITKVVVFTRENDAARARYMADGATLVERLVASEALLEDVATVDDTMAGARRRRADFEQYKQTQKNQILSIHSLMMGAFDTLNLRLENNGRPPFAPPAELAPTALKGRIAALVAKEAVEPALRAEVNRQIKLAHLHAKHTQEADKLALWLDEQLAALAAPVTALSSGDARKQLKLSESFGRAAADKRSRVFAAVQAQSAELERERYERLADAQAREAAITAAFAAVDKQAAANQPVLADNLGRELFKEDVLMKVDVHRDIYDNLVAWAAKKCQYFDARELVGSVQEARLQLSTLDAVDSEIEDTSLGNFGRLRELGDQIRSALYASALSEWRHPDPDAVAALEAAVAASFADELGPKSVLKHGVLDDHLAREQVKEKVANWISTHQRKQKDVLGWGQKKAAYLAVAEQVGSSAEATYQLSVLQAYADERATAEAGEIATLRELGRAIRAERYATVHSEWACEAPEAVARLEELVADQLVALGAAYDGKKAVLDDALARELFAEETRLMAGQHIDKATLCARWANEKAAYLQQDAVVHSMREAQVALSVLAAYEVENAKFTATAVASLKQLGAEIVGRAYQSSHSSYAYEAPDEVTDRESEVAEHWQKLALLAGSRLATLTALLTRETRKEELRVDFADRAADFVGYCADQTVLVGSADDQRISFGTSVGEVEGYAAVLDGQDAAVDIEADRRRARCNAIVAEMAALVSDTEQFDQAQQEAGAAEASGGGGEAEDEVAPLRSASGGSTADAEPAAAAEESVSSTPKTVRRKRFGTLTKSLKKAFGKSKRKRSHLAKLKEQAAETGGAAAAAAAAAADLPWPEPANPYTQLTVAALQAAQAELDAAQEARKAVFAAELERWKEDDELCKAFSEATAPMQQFAAATIESMGGRAGAGLSEEEQLAAVQLALGSLQEVCFKIPEVRTAEQTLKARRVSTNPYTTVSVALLECELETVQSVANQKKPSLEAMIEYKRFKGITPEQHAEMETLFKEHDTDNSNSISAKELRKCLFSLGEERSRSEIAGYVSTYGVGKQALSFDQFRELMTVLIGDMGTPEGLIESFRVVSRNREAVPLSALAELLAPQDVAFFADEAPKVTAPPTEAEEPGGGGEADDHDFAAWVAAVCAR